METTKNNKKDLTPEELDALQRPDYSHIEDYEGVPLWSEILPKLFQGGTAPTEELEYTGLLSSYDRIQEGHFGTVVTLYASAMPVDWFVKEIRLGIYDADMTDFRIEELFDIVRTAHTDWKKGYRVLIRCQAGWNRSGLVMALVLMREGYTAEEAISLIRDRRSQYALCNPDFEDFLLKEDADKWRGETYG